MNSFRILGILLLASCWGPARASVEIIPTHGRNVYRLAFAKAPDGGAIVGSTYDNRVCAFTLAGAHRWDAVVGGFVFDLATGDLDGDGRDEIVAAGADGIVSVFASDGRQLWTADMEAPVYQVAVARLDGSHPVVLAAGISRRVVAFGPRGEKLVEREVTGAVRMMRAADFDGDGQAEVAVLPVGGRVGDLQFFRGTKLEPTALRIASPAVRDPAMGLRQANGIVADVDGDGVTDLVYKPGVFTLKGGARRLVEFPDRFDVASYDHHYTMRFVAAGDLTDAPGTEFVLVEGPQVRLCGADGRKLGHVTAAFGFTDALYLPGTPHGSVLLGSSPNGDDNLYRVTFTPGWEDELAKLERRGLMATIGTTLARLGDEARTCAVPPAVAPAGPFDVVLATTTQFGAWKASGVDRAIGQVRAEKEEFPYPSLRFGVYVWTGEDAPLLRPDGKPWPRDRRLAHGTTREELLTAARKFEAAGCSFWLHLGHGCAPTLELATVQALLEVAPKTLRGFVSAEDEQLDEIPYYFEHYLRPVLELSLRHDKRVILRQKNIWWAYWPSHPAVREHVLNGRYHAVLLPCVEDSNSRSADVNLAGRVGLWLNSEVDGWASRSISDQFSFNRLWEWEYPMTGHPTLRYNVTQAALGARVFLLLSGERKNLAGPWTRVGSEGAVTFLHLLGRGVLTPPRRDQFRGLSPVAIVMHEPTRRFQTHGVNGHDVARWAGDGTDAKPWAFDRLDTYWGMAPLPPTDVATYLWGRRRRDASQIAPTAPHGFVALLAGEPRRDGPWTIRWTTDGDGLSKDGRNYPLAEARTLLETDLAAAGQQLPVQVEGRAFHHVIAETPDRYLLVLVDPGWLDPASRAVKFRSRLSGDWMARDRLSGETLGAAQVARELTVPAGGLRLIELRRVVAPR